MSKGAWTPFDNVPRKDAATMQWWRLRPMRGHGSFTDNRHLDATVQPSWKPITLRPTLLLSITALNLGFIAVLEYLSQKSRLHGGVALAKTTLSPSVNFGYLYLPTVIAVIYSMLWSWIDLDTKRLEPHFQLSRPGQSSNTNPLYLHYPFEFIAAAPLRALRRRSDLPSFTSRRRLIVS